MPTFNAKDRRTYQNICHLTENGVLAFMRDFLTPRYETVITAPAYIYAIGNIPVALVAHADTVFKIPPDMDNFFYDQEKDVIWNPDGAGADDRAGIFAIVKIIRHYRLRPHIIITTGEETGCIGAGKLIAHETTFPAELKFMIQLDRRNRQDAVFYDCDNPEFEKFITSFGFKTELGTLSDISLLAPVWKVAAVNLSVGYEDEHMNIERLHVNWLYETINKVVNILQYVEEHPELKKFEYIPNIYSSYFFNRFHYNWYDYDDCFETPEGYEHCFMCNQLARVDSMIPIWYPHGKHSYNLCLDCHADLSHQIIWCVKCGRAYYLSESQVKNIPDINNWHCEDCVNGVERNTETVQQGNSAQPGSNRDATKYGSDFHGMGEEQRMVLFNDQNSRIRASGTYLF